MAFSRTARKPASVRLTLQELEPREVCNNLMASDLLSGLAPAFTALVASAGSTLGGSVDSPIRLSGEKTDAPARHAAAAEQWASRLPDSTVHALTGNAPALAPADSLFQSVFADPSAGAYGNGLFTSPPHGAAKAGSSSAAPALYAAGLPALALVASPAPQFVASQPDYTLAVGSGVGHGSGSGSGSASSSSHTESPAAAAPMQAFGRGRALDSGPSSSGTSQGPFTWIGGAAIGDPTAWENGQNWLDNTGFRSYLAPGDNDDVIFDGTVSNADCIDNSSFAVGSITVAPSYSSTITFYPAMSIARTFDFEGGEVIQAGGAGNALSVNGPFIWDNPTGKAFLNIAGTLSDFVLNNHATIKGTDLKIGDNLDLNGATVDFNTTGSLTFTKNAGISINTGGKFNWNSTANIVTTGTGMIVNNGGTLQLSSLHDGVTVKSDLPYVDNSDNGGTLDIEAGTLYFDKANAVSNVSVLHNAGHIIIGTNATPKATLQVDQGLIMNGGDLTSAGGKTSYLNGGDIQINDGKVYVGGLVAIGELDSDHKVSMLGGTLYMDVNLKGNPIWDKWHSDVGFLLGTHSVLSVITVAKPNPLPFGLSMQILDTPQVNLITGDFGTKNVNIDATNSYTPGPDGTRQYYLLNV